MRISTQRFIVPLLVSFSLTGAAVLLLYFLNKKKNEDDLKVKNKKSEEVSVVMTIPRQLVPAVIGRAGLTITKIQMNTKTKIIFNSEDDVNLPERTCIITGKLDNIKLAKQEIRCILNNQPIIETYETWVPQKTMGRILDRGGELFSQIQNSSNAKIIFTDPSNLSPMDLDTKQRVILKGTAEQIADALLQIEDKVKEDKEMRIKTENSSYNRVPRIKTPPAITSQSDSKNAEYSKVVFGNFTNEGLMEVFVTAVESPNKFYIQVGSTISKLDALMVEMSTYYEVQENKELHTLKNISVGQMIATKFSDNLWYRGEIVTDLGDQMYNVYYVDYGDQMEVNGSNIFELRTDFLSHRLQAIECSLAGVKPWDGNEWSETATQTFRSLLQDDTQLCTAKIRGYKERAVGCGLSRREGSPIPCVDLYWKSGNQTLNMAQELLSRHELARPDTEPWSAASSTISLTHQPSATSVARSPEPARTPTPTTTSSTKTTSNGYEQIDLTVSPQPKTPASRIEVIDLTTSPPSSDATRSQQRVGDAATNNFLAHERGAGGGGFGPLTAPPTNGTKSFGGGGNNNNPRNRPANPFATDVSGGGAGGGGFGRSSVNIIPAGFESDEDAASDEFEIY